MDAGAAVMNFPRRDARDKLAGRTRYTVDRAAPGMLHAAVLRSEVAAARIVRARRLGGRTRCPACARSITASGRARPVRHRHRRPSAVRLRHGCAITASRSPRSRRRRRSIAQAALPRDRRRDRAAAALSSPWRRRWRPARRYVHPDWEDLRGARRGRRAARGNVAWEATVVRGDADAAFARDDVTIVESQFRVGRQNHVSLRAARRYRALSRRAASISKPRRRCPGRCAT